MRWVWTGWLLLIAVSFGVLEGYALNRDDGLTLSQYIADLSAQWPLVPVLYGLLVGGLAVHLFWYWVPKTKGDGK